MRGRWKHTAASSSRGRAWSAPQAAVIVVTILVYVSFCQPLYVRINLLTGNSAAGKLQRPQYSAQRLFICPGKQAFPPRSDCQLGAPNDRKLLLKYGLPA